MTPNDKTHHEELREIVDSLEGVEGGAATQLRRNAEKLLHLPEADVAALAAAATIAVEKGPGKRRSEASAARPRVCPICRTDISHLARQARYCSRSCQEKAARLRADRLPFDVARLLRYAHSEGRLAEVRKIVREWQPPAEPPSLFDQHDTGRPTGSAGSYGEAAAPVQGGVES